jgi:recombination protein RecA
MPTAAEIRDQINASLGKDAVQMGNDPRYVVTHIPTGILPVDVLLDGGLPRGRIIEFFGQFSSLKSYLGLCAIAQVQDDGGTAALIDTEHAYDPVWAASIGVDNDALILYQPTTAEQACDAMQIALDEGIDLIVWDSVAASQPKAESEVMLSGDKNIQPARLAAFMSIALRRLNSSNSNTAILCINQTRSKVGVTFGSPETTPGGNSLPFYASVRIRFVKSGRVTETRQQWDGEKMATVRDTTVQKIRCELVKSKLGRPEREQWFQWDVRESQVDITGYLISVGLEVGQIKKTGSSWQIGKDKFRGEKQVRKHLDSNPRLRHRLRQSALSLGSGTPSK